MNIEKDEKVLDFFIERELDPLTQVEYIRHIKYYIEHAGDNLTPTQLIDEAIEEERAKVPLEDRKIEKRFKRFKKWLLEQDYSSETKRGMLGCIKTFYITSHVKDIPKTKIKTKRKKRIKVKDLINADEIKTAYLEANIQYRAIILLGATSGLSRIDIRHLKLSTFVEGFNNYAKTSVNCINDIDQAIRIASENEIIIKWESERGKNDIEYLTYSSHETTIAILQYLRADPPKNQDDYLFRVKGKIICKKTFTAYFNRLNRRLGWGNISKYKKVLSHNLRRWFGSMLMEAGVGYRHAEYMLGHILGSTQEAYYKLPSETSMFEAYLKALPYLTILEPIETKIFTDEYRKKTDAEIAELKKMVKKLMEERKFKSDKKEEKYKRLP